MSKLAAGHAMTAGFRLISREPLIFAGWIGFELLVTMVMSILIQAVAPGAGANPGSPATLLALLISFGVGVMLASAVMRAALEPDERRGLYLRLGPQEAWLAVTQLVLAVIVFLGMIVLAILVSLPIGLVVGLAAGNSPATAIVLLGVAYAVMLAAAVWIFVRLGLSLPMAFGERRLAIGEAWRTSKGESGPIFGVIGALTAVMVLAYAVVFGGAFSMITAVIPLERLSQEIQTNPAALNQALSPTAMMALSLLLVLVSAILRVAFFGAWADIYRQLGGRPAAADTFN